MLRHALLALALLATAPAFAQAPATAAADSSFRLNFLRDGTADFTHVPLGLCEDYPEESTTKAIYDADFDLLNRAGIDYMRVSFGWDGIETAKDTYDWGFWDDLVRTAVDEHHLTLVPYVCYTPKWNSTNQDDAFYWRSPPVDYEQFGQFMFDLVTRYKDRIHSWELWNEPDIEWYWTGDPEGFARLIKIGSEAVRRADPTATIVLGGIAHNPDFLQTLFRDQGLSPYVDVVNMHSYFETWHGAPVESIGDYVNRVGEVVERYGDGQPLWMAEVGYGTVREGAHVSDDYTAYYDYEHTLPYQAVALARTITAALATDKLSALAWYEIKDLPAGDAVIGDNNNRHLGVAFADHTPKPAQHALSFVNRFYAEPMRSLDRETTFSRAATSDVVVHAFEQADGDVLVAAWLQTRRMGMQDDPGDGMHADTRREAVSVSVPRATRGAATRYDELGETHPAPRVQQARGQTTVPLTLTGGTITLVRIAKR